MNNNVIKKLNVHKTMPEKWNIIHKFSHGSLSIPG